MRLFTVIGEPLLVPVMPLGLEVAVKLVIAEPPLLAGALKVTVACPSDDPTAALAGALAAALAPVGAPGNPAGVAAPEGAEAALGPAVLNATTVNVYAVPLVNPDTTIGDAPPDALIAVDTPPIRAVTEKLVVALRPTVPGVNDTVACESPVGGPSTVTPAGAPGTAAPACGVTLLDGAEGTPMPAMLVAVTVNV